MTTSRFLYIATVKGRYASLRSYEKAFYNLVIEIPSDPTDSCLDRPFECKSMLRCSVLLILYH